MARFRHVVPAVLLAACNSGENSATTSAVQVLSEPEAAFAESFSFIQQVRELPDGRVLVADPLEQRVVVLDMDAGTEVPVGRVGQGPEEFMQPDAVFPMPGDSTLLVDLGNGRLVMLGPDFTFGPTMPMAQENTSDDGPIGMAVIFPRAVDGNGNVFIEPFGFGGRPGGDPPDSAIIARWNRSVGAVDTLGMAKLPERVQQSSGGNFRIRQVPLSPRDAWNAGVNGRVAVARAEPYRLDWIDPDGTITEGPVVPYEPIPIGQAEKEAWAEGRGSGGLTIEVGIDNGMRRMAFRRGGGGGSRPDLDSYTWPDYLPPFVANGVLVSPEGEAWVEQSRSAGAPRRYQVFDASGNPKGQVELPQGRRVVGFGSGVVYTILRDEFDLIFLEKYQVTT